MIYGEYTYTEHSDGSQFTREFEADVPFVRDIQEMRELLLEHVVVFSKYGRFVFTVSNADAQDEEPLEVEI
jgi:hypothetical protein